MKLFFLIENNQPHASGGGYYAIFKFAEQLALRGHDIFIYAVHDFGWLANSDKIKIYYRPSISRKNPFLRKLDKALDVVCDFFILSRLISRFEPDWIFGVLKESAIKAVKFSRRFDISVANFIYECPPWLKEIYGSELYAQHDQPYIRKVWQNTKQAYLESDLLFPNSSLSKEFNQKWLDNKTVCQPIHPGVDPLTMPYVEPIYSTENKSVLFVGRLAYEKNVQHLIAAWHKLPTYIHLHIVGSGPQKDVFMDMSKDLTNITFHGFVTDDQLWELYKTCAVLICPSNFEGFGMPPMQALYFGKPCLVSDIPIFHSIYADYVDYFALGNIDEIVTKVSNLLDDADYQKMKGQAGRQYILEYFTWAHAAEAIELNLLAHQK